MAYLLYNSSKIELNENDLLIGRSKDADLVLEGATVSRRHALIKKFQNSYYISDLGSSNGTFLGHRRVQIPLQLCNKDVIKIGDVLLTFVQEIEEEDEEADVTVIQERNKVINSILLVIDIRGYTKLAETIDIKSLSHIMSKWFEESIEIIDTFEGTLDKFIGDCVYARWDEEINKENIIKAIKTSLKIREAIKKLTSDIATLTYEVEVGVGIHCGEVVLEQGAYSTGLGDNVNKVFELESLTKTVGKNILFSPEAFDLLEIDDDKNELWIERVKGNKDSLRAFGFTFEEIQELLNEV